MLPRTSASALAMVRHFRWTILSAALSLCQGPAYSQNYSPANCCHPWTGHVFYISYGTNHVHELYYNGAWSDHDLTAITNGPKAVGSGRGPGLTSFFDGSLEHVFYVGWGDSHVHELYYNGAWWGNDLTAATNGPRAYVDSITSLFDGSLEHVFYVSPDDVHVHELYYNLRTSDGGATWHSQNFLSLRTTRDRRWDPFLWPLF